MADDQLNKNEAKKVTRNEVSDNEKQKFRLGCHGLMTAVLTIPQINLAQIEIRDHRE